MEISLTDLHRYSDTLASQIREQPNTILPLVEVFVLCLTCQFEAAAKTCAAEFRNVPEEETRPIQIILLSDDHSLSIRDVQVYV